MNQPRSVAVFVFAILLSARAHANEPSLHGFRPDRIPAHHAFETRLAEQLRADHLREWMQRMTPRPHHAGSPQARANAEFVAERFRSWGFDTRVETFHVLLPTPKTRELERLEPEPFVASLVEPALVEGDVAEAIRAEGLPPYNAYSSDGEVTGELVYVNQGVPDDYAVLERHGISVDGRIVIARYGGSWRGIKPKVAAENGAVGCILFSDPHEDGYFQGPVYPDGPYKHEAGAQRGSVVDLPRRPGDPLTPGYGATRDAERLSRSDAETLMTIPVLPISWKDALPLLKTIGGPVAPPGWRGALPVTYRLGPGPAKVRLQTAFNWDLVPAYNVIARLEGSEYPDQWIIRGNHHDAWVVGARDPISGLVALMEQARVTGEAARSGWRPRRTLVFCAWDAEEPGLLGSTEWVEHHAETLGAKAVAYINTDGNTRGFLSIGGSHSLERLVAQVARDVIDPQTNVSIADRHRSALLVRGSARDRERAHIESTLRIHALGSGSDYTAFLQHLGIASLNLSFRGEGNGGEYHTSFDTFDHYSRFGDPTFAYGRTLADTCGRLMLRLSEADVLPFSFVESARAIGEYVDEVVALADDSRKETERRNELIRNRHFELAADPASTYVVPDAEEPVPHINFAPLLNARDALRKAAHDYDQTLQSLFSKNRALPHDRAAALDRILYRVERALCTDDGLPRRPWFRHQVYAPGFYTGYGVKTLPGVREAIEQRRWDEADTQMRITTDAIQRYASAIDQATAIVVSAE